MVTTSMNLAELDLNYSNRSARQTSNDSFYLTENLLGRSIFIYFYYYYYYYYFNIFFYFIYFIYIFCYIRKIKD